MWNKAEYRNKIEKNQITFKLNLNVLYTESVLIFV